MQSGSVFKRSFEGRAHLRNNKWEHTKGTSGSYQGGESLQARKGAERSETRGHLSSSTYSILYKRVLLGPERTHPDMRTSASTILLEQLHKQTSSVFVHLLKMELTKYGKNQSLARVFGSVEEEKVTFGRTASEVPNFRFCKVPIACAGSPSQRFLF